MQELFKSHVYKIIITLNSIDSEQQLYSGKVMISNFVDYWNWRKIDKKKIRSNLAIFNTIYNLKRKHLQNYD